ncbi:alpha/beta hydrolase [Neolewinella antarctica]|uniref:Serine aminopeptidase S33 domain-containing protein n=1 Tax=Neolewinella antarctica TaxID=442734 RepID=A0ABX0XBS4_9BACT|nr:alpha/beta fold hydrolase [Neolewinella antarctica]NJC26283.1 hypothetical protein [Neolewinella antarctica]
MLYALGIFSLLALLAAYVLIERKLPYVIITPYRRKLTDTPGNYGLAYEQFRLRVDDAVELDTFFIPATTPARANLIILHGIGSGKEVYLPLLPELCRMGYNILLWDQRAHGRSDGTYVTFGAREVPDVSRGLDWLDARTPHVPTGIYGNSMGGAVALQSLAADARLRFGLIESTFSTLPDITHAYGIRMAGFWVPRWLTDRLLGNAGKIAGFRPFAIRPVDAVAEITQPVLLIHGDADNNININHAHRLFAALGSADKAFHVVPGGDHADLWERGGNEYKEVWYGFFRKMLTAL